MIARSHRSTVIAVVVVLLVALGGTAIWIASRAREYVIPPAPTNPDAALAELRSGNARYVKSARTLSADTAHDAEHRQRTVNEQHPFVALLCCSDSRVVPEFIFDQRSGSIFEIRNAGNVVDDDVLASFEYAVEHLHVPLILVLAHKGCGAIHAVCEAGEKPLHDHLRELQKHMTGLHADILNTHNPHNPAVLDALSKKNAHQQALALLSESTALKSAVEKGEVKLMYGIYNMDSGVVEFFDPK